MKPGRFSEPVRTKHSLLSRFALLLAPVGALAAVTTADAAPPHTQTWYVSATAPAGGNGSASAPFNSISQLVTVYGPGDTIMIEPAPVGTVLNGGLPLLPGQRLIGDGPPVVKSGASLIPNGPPVMVSSGASSLPQITNTTTYLNGDAIELASNTVVENLVIVGPARGGIYGQDALNVTIRGNDISGFNTSGAPGFVVQPFFSSSYIEGGGTYGESGINAGWAAILLDTASGSSSVVVSNNYIHDGACGDGIDIRGMNTGDVTAQVTSNYITRLVQCSSVGTIEGIGTQVTGTSHMRAMLVGNTEANTGSPGANMDSLFVDPAESGSLTETIDQNVYMNGIGGASTNGFEYIVSNGDGTSSVTISNSYFENNPGDMLQELNFAGEAAKATLILDNVTVVQTTIDRGNPAYAMPPGTLTGATNTGDCLDIVSNGFNDTTIFQMIDSSFTGCDNNGIEVLSNQATGNGPAGNIHTIAMDIRNSTSSGAQFYNLWVNIVSPLTNLSVKVQDTNLSFSESGVAAAFDLQPTGATTNYTIDLGGGTLGSMGGNCIFGSPIYNLEATGYNVFAEHNWWGTPSGPPSGSVHESTAGFTIDASKFLQRPPPVCSAN
jgi:hypothetical protein